MTTETEAQVLDALAWVINRDAREHGIDGEYDYRRYYRRMMHRDAADALNRCDSCERRETAMRWIHGLTA